MTIFKWQEFVTQFAQLSGAGSLAPPEDEEEALSFVYVREERDVLYIGYDEARDQLVCFFCLDRLDGSRPEIIKALLHQNARVRSADSPVFSLSSRAVTVTRRLELDEQTPESFLVTVDNFMDEQLDLEEELLSLSEAEKSRTLETLPQSAENAQTLRA